MLSREHFQLVASSLDLQEPEGAQREAKPAKANKLKKKSQVARHALIHIIGDNRRLCKSPASTTPHFGRSRSHHRLLLCKLQAKSMFQARRCRQVLSRVAICCSPAVLEVFPETVRRAPYERLLKSMVP